MYGSPLMRGMMMRRPVGAMPRAFADGGHVDRALVAAAPPVAPTRLSLTPDLLQRLAHLQPEVRYGNPLTMQRNSEHIDRMEDLRRRAEVSGIGASSEFAQGGAVMPARAPLAAAPVAPPAGYGTRPMVPWQTPMGAPFARGGLSSERQEAPAPGGALRHATGPGGGQDDKIPARLSDGEVVWPADVVSHVGDGSNNEGARRLMAASDQIRAEKAASSKGGRFPDKAKPPLAYIKGRGKKAKRGRGALKDRES